MWARKNFMCFFVRNTVLDDFTAVLYSRAKFLFFLAHIDFLM